MEIQKVLSVLASKGLRVTEIKANMTHDGNIFPEIEAVELPGGSYKTIEEAVKAVMKANPLFEGGEIAGMKSVVKITAETYYDSNHEFDQQWESDQIYTPKKVQKKPNAKVDITITVE